VKRRLSYERRRWIEGYVFVLPYIIGIIVLFAFPVFTSIRISLSDIVRFGGFKMRWLGFDHYQQAFVWDVNFIPNFVQAVGFTLINAPLIVVFSLIFAVLLNKDLRLKGFFRTVFFLPFLLGTGYIMDQLLGQGVDEQSVQVARGILFPDEVILYLGPRVYSSINGFLNRITIVLWRQGVQVLLFLSGLQGIPVHLYESAKVDGATEWEMFWKITLPMISPVIVLTIVYTIIDSFVDIGNPLLEYIYNAAFRNTQFEYSAAMSWIYAAFVFLVLGVVFLLSRRFVFEAGRR
jgi:ABC-type sugar transport system permease subunit